jgi:hypothetical protein
MWNVVLNGLLIVIMLDLFLESNGVLNSMEILVVLKFASEYVSYHLVFSL